MKKLNNKGFMLTETLVVASFVIATLVFFYIQFRTVNKSYNISFKYNTVEELYALGNVKNYLKNNGLSTVTSMVTNAQDEYVDITKCSSYYLAESDYCLALMSTLNVKQIIVTKENLDTFKNITNSVDTLSEDMKQFISVIKYNTDDIGFRLIAEFQNGTYATIAL